MTHLVAVKLTDAEVKLLDDIVDICGYKTRSEALRDLIVTHMVAEDADPDVRDAIRLQRCGHPMRRRKGFRTGKARDDGSEI